MNALDRLEMLLREAMPGKIKIVTEDTTLRLLELDMALRGAAPSLIKAVRAGEIVTMILDENLGKDMFPSPTGHAACDNFRAALAELEEKEKTGARNG